MRRYNTYKDVEIDASKLPHDEIGRFLMALEDEESRWLRWLNSNVHDVHIRKNALFWVKVPVRLSHLLPSLLGTNMFLVHHGTADYIMMVKGPGRLTDISNIPLFGTHYMRVECVVVDAHDIPNKYLVVKEMIGSKCCKRKLVTGSVEPGEFFARAAEREVFEETGIKAKFMGILGIINRLKSRFDRDEILVGCALHAIEPNQQPQITSNEIKGVEWVAEDILSQSKGATLQKWLESYQVHNFHNRAEALETHLLDFNGRRQMLYCTVP